MEVQLKQTNGFSSYNKIIKVIIKVINVIIILQKIVKLLIIPEKLEEEQQFVSQYQNKVISFQIIQIII